MPSKDIIVQACKDIVELKLKAIDSFIQDVIEPLEEVGSPEKLIGKPYKQWTPQDLQMMSMIYKDKLDKYIFDKEYLEVIALEKGGV